MPGTKFCGLMSPSLQRLCPSKERTGQCSDAELMKRQRRVGGVRCVRGILGQHGHCFGDPGIIVFKHNNDLISNLEKKVDVMVLPVQSSESSSSLGT